MKQILDNVESKMKKAADNLEANLRTIRTGRANANMLERVSVEYYEVRRRSIRSRPSRSWRAVSSS